MSTVTTILFGRTCWASALGFGGSLVGPNVTRRISVSLMDNYTNFCSIQAKVTQKLAECHCNVKCGKSWKTSKIPRKLRHSGVVIKLKWMFVNS